MFVNALINYITIIREHSNLFLCINIKTSEQDEDHIFTNNNLLCQLMECMGIETLKEANNKPITIECTGDPKEGILSPMYLCDFITQKRLIKLNSGLLLTPDLVLVLTDNKE